jgi:cytochrome c
MGERDMTQLSTKTGIAAAIGALVAMTSLGASAAPAGRELARNKGCMECHAVGKEVWGPSYRQIAKYYRPLPNGKALMGQKILKGGAEHYGERSMPAHATRPVPVSETEAEQIAAWILTVK